MIEITVNGDPFTDFVAASVRVSLETLANDFSFTASAKVEERAVALGETRVQSPLKQGDAVTVRVQGVKVMTGFIDEVNGSDAEGGHMVTYTGRDKTGDFIDSTIDILPDIRASSALTLKRVIETVVEHVGTEIGVIDNLNPAPFNAAEDILGAQVGDPAVDFVMIYARKRQALLTSDGDANIVITQSSPIDSGAALQRIQGANDNNILTQSWAINASLRFNKYVRRGQLDPRALNLAGDTSAETVENQSGIAEDSEVRVGRQNIVVESESYSSGQLQDRAKWAKQLAQAKATRFNCTVVGHTLPGATTDLWTINTLVQINSDVADISRKMLINTATFSEGEGRPTVTALEFVERNVYTIDDKILSQRPAGDQNDAFRALG